MDLTQYLQTIFADLGENEYIRLGWEIGKEPNQNGLFKTKKRDFQSFRKLNDCQTHIENLKKIPSIISIWICPNTFNEDNTHEEDKVSSIHWMFVDIDFTDIDKIQSKIDQFDLYPSIIVNTGKGVQLYWKLNDKWTSDEWKKIQEEVRDYFSADRMARRAGFLLRVPDTENRKYLLEEKRKEGYANAYKCEVLEFNNKEYKHNDFPEVAIEEQLESVRKPLNLNDLPGPEGLKKVRQYCPVVNDAFNAIEQGDAENKAGHNQRLLAASMHKYTINNEQYVLNLFSNCSDFNESITLSQYRSIKKGPFTCKKLQSSEWDYACKETCPLMKDIGKKSPITFAYRNGDQLELTADLLRKTDNENAFEEVMKRIKNENNLLSRYKLIRQVSVAYGIRETEIKQYLRDVVVYDERLPFFINGKVDEVKAAEFIIRKYNVIRYLEEFYRYDTGIWKRLPQEETEALIHKEIREYSSNHVVSEVLSAIKRESLVTQQVVDAVRDKHIIACKNGLLDVRSKNLVGFRPEDYRFQKMNASYDPDAKCPGFFGVVDELFKGDADATEKKMLLQEYMGYLLIPDYTIVKKMLYMWGPKANNGKSTVIDIIYALMGESYIDSIPLNKLDGFMLNRLIGKHANIVADQDAMTKVPDGVFKQLVGGRDRITADVKYKDAVNFKNTARLIFAVNKLPYSQAKDSGYYTRIVTLVFNNEFVVNPQGNQMQANPEKIDAIIEQELDGILNWALEGLDRLLVNRKLTIPPSSRDALEDYQVENNSVMLFVKEECEIGPVHEIKRIDLYEKYVAWCRENGFNKNVNSRTFYKTMDLQYGIKSRKSGDYISRNKIKLSNKSTQPAQNLPTANHVQIRLWATWVGL